MDMDTSNPAVFVNAELLCMYVGRKVQAAIQVVQSDGGGVVGKSTDGKQLVVKGLPPLPLTTCVEVIGIADSNQSIHTEIWTNFGDTFDTYNYKSALPTCKWGIQAHVYLRKYTITICNACMHIACLMMLESEQRIYNNMKMNQTAP